MSCHILSNETNKQQQEGKKKKMQQAICLIYLALKINHNCELLWPAMQVSQLSIDMR